MPGHSRRWKEWAYFIPDLALRDQGFYLNKQGTLHRECGSRRPGKEETHTLLDSFIITEDVTL